MKVVALILAFAALSLLNYGTSVGQQLSYESPAGTKYLLYTPPSYSTGSDNFPLLISLHGVAEIGDDLTKLTVGGALTPARLIHQGRWPASRPLLVLSPQLKPTVEEPDPEWPANYIEEVVQHVVANFRVDLNRIYITGLSRGGTGVWTYAAAYPNRVAAMIPISGVCDVSTACTIKDIAIWAFHGEADQVIQTFYPLDMAVAIGNCSNPKYKPHVNLMEVREHTGWEEVYNETNGYPVFDWLLKFTKNSPANTAPYVNAGADRQFMMRSGPLHIIGDFFDSDGTITNVQWTQTSGAALSLSNTNNRFLTINSVQTGTFEFQLSVTDDDGVQQTDRVVITVLANSTLPIVTNMVLVNGAGTNVDIGNITEGMVIDINDLDLTQINIRAEAVNTPGSVRFSVNTDQNTRTSSTPFLIKPTNDTKPEWEIKPGEYLICATPFTGGSGTGTRGVSQCYKITVVDGAPNSTCSNLGSITREVWTGITGTNVSDIPLATPPSFTRLTTIFETPTNIDDNYGQRVRGYICPPLTGNYTFWIASNDRSELWLSTNADPANKVRIALVNTSTAVRGWTTNASQQSAPINLQAGVRYYIEALHKEGIGGNDNLAVGWQLPNGAFERPIPGDRLIPFGPVSNPPTVAITGPTGGATFTAPANIAISANATANSGTITKVEFFNGATKLGEDTTSPYSFAWNSVPAGSYSLNAKATDSGGLSTTSALVNITVNPAGTPPTVSLTAPTAGQLFAAPATIAITANATATGGTITKVEFYNGANKLGEDATNPYTFSWTAVPVGSYAITAKATDSNTLTTTSAIVNVSVVAPPTVNITAPTAGQTFNAPANIAINATATAGSGTITKVEFFNGANKLGEDLSSPYAFAWNSVAAGNYALTAKATDSNGFSTTTAAVNITVNPPGTPPTVNITSPAGGQVFAAPATIAISANATATNGTISKVEFFNGANKLGEDLSAPYTFNWTSVAAGNYALTAKATDSNTLSTTSAAVNISVNTPPAVNITTPADGQTFTAPASITINASATANNGTISKVEFFNGANKLGEDLTSPYSYSWTSVAEGSYTLVARATDSNGLTNSSASVGITVNPGGPVCSASGTISREVWTNITGATVASIPVNTAPTSTSVLSIFEGPTNSGTNYGARVRGYICAPSTGNYIFWIASNDNSELWLSTDNNPANKVMIASVTGYTTPRQWTKYASQQSANIPLVAGQQYYIEALHKQGTGSDNLAVGWQLPDGTLERPIAGARLSPFGPSSNPPTVTITSPTNGQVFPDPASINIAASASPGTNPVSKVEFYNNTTLLGDDLSAPYSFNWDGVPAGSYTIVAKAIDSEGLSSSASVNVVVSSGQTCSATGTIERELWTNVTGATVASIPVNTAPTSTSTLTLFEGPTNAATNYGARIRGYICVPSSGNYIFWIASNDNSELWLSTDNNPANKVLIASVTGYTTPRQWTKYPSQQSAGIALVAGQQYYIEALHKQGTGSDNLAVGWQLPDGTLERPIAGTRLSPFGPSSNPPTVTITSPTNGQVFPDPASINITASVSPGTNPVSKVEFYNGTILLGDDLSAPYAFSWNGVPAGGYTIVAKAIDTEGLSSSTSVNVVVSSGQTCSATGTIQREVWSNITGATVASVPFNTAPTSTSMLTSFEAPTNVGTNYGSRIRGYLCVPSSGNYIFWIASNDNSELWLSTDDNPANKVLIASVTGYTTPRQWTKYPTQQSAAVPLVAGQQYYVEALHKQATGSDNLAVGWQLPNGTQERPILGNRISPFGGAAATELALHEIANPDYLNFEKTDVTLYPNPLDKNEFTVQITGARPISKESQALVEIASMAGTKVFDQNIDCQQCSEIKVRLRDNLGAGVYMVHVMIDGKRFVKRLVVM